ncbi:MAG: hypothetical protein H6R26_2025, partial [Proteobacteria bacterium]|nr:hypothetical protein [Pseudomonadota bacterium]
EGMPLGEIFNIVHGNTRAPVASPLIRGMRENRVVRLADHTVLVSRDGTEFGIDDSTAPIRDADGNVVGAVLVFRDVTEPRRLVGEISYQATHDPLTGLLNRAVFEKRLLASIESSRQKRAEHVLCYVDLDQFKQLNDACGHAAGDQLLRQVGGALARCARSRDTLARMGGDEFAVLLEHCDMVNARSVAEEICWRLERLHVRANRRFRISASIGLVAITGQWPNTTSALQAADMACYAAKESGRNRLHVYKQPDLPAQDRRRFVDWGARIEQAIEQDRFLLYGQRIHALRGSHAKPQCEVLLRLQDAAGHVISPGAFLPEAERLNIAARVDHWTLRNVLGLLRESPERCAPFERISINLSGQSLGEATFRRSALHLLESSGADLTKLCFEVTETAAMEHADDAATFIRDLHANGIAFSLDDFGNGFSSFGHLKALPVDYVKIDGRLVKNILDDPLDRVAVKCFAEVAKAAGKQAIAEWVENEATGMALRELGIDYVQGYWHHCPEPLPQALDLN